MAKDAWFVRGWENGFFIQHCHFEIPVFGVSFSAFVLFFIFCLVFCLLVQIFPPTFSVKFLFLFTALSMSYSLFFASCMLRKTGPKARSDSRKETLNFHCVVFRSALGFSFSPITIHTLWAPKFKVYIRLSYLQNGFLDKRQREKALVLHHQVIQMLENRKYIFLKRLNKVLSPLWWQKQEDECTWDKTNSISIFSFPLSGTTYILGELFAHYLSSLLFHISFLFFSFLLLLLSET